MNDKKSELDKKRALLEEYRKRKKEKELLKQQQQQIPELSNSLINTDDLKQNKSLLNEFDNLSIDEILSKCIGTITPSTSSFSLSYSSSTNSLSNSFYSTSNLNKIKTKSASQIDQEAINRRIEKLKLKPELDLKTKVDIYPIEKIKYAKETQTINSLFDEHNSKLREHNLSDHSGEDDDENEKNTNQNGHSKTKNKSKSKKNQLEHHKPLAFYDDVFVFDTFHWEDEFNPFDSHDEKNNQHNNNNNTSSNNKSTHHSTNQLDLKKLMYLENELNQDSDNYDDDDLTDDIEQNLKTNLGSHEEHLKSSNEIDYDDFLRFMVIKRPIVERALRQNEQNIFVDYSSSNNDEKLNEEQNLVTIQLKKSFQMQDKLSSSVITCMDWSLQFPELLLCSYDNMSYNYDDSDSEAVIAIWSAKSDQKLPQQVFTSTSLITSCVFSTYHPNLIVAGTYSGQIVMWDIRSNKRTPVQRSSLSISSHVNPVYCIKVMESQSLVSVSNDGKLCTWSLENLNTPLDSSDLVLKHSTNKQVYATCLDFQTVCSNELDNKNIEKNGSSISNQQRQAIIGAEDGFSHSLLVNNKYSLNQTFEGHFGPVTGVSCFSQCSSEFNTQSYANNYSLSQLFLTSSFDSTIKLWNMMDNTSPIYTFESRGDYVYDVGWSPINPALFACVDGSGRLDFWNLNKDIEAPTASIDIDNRTRAINKLKWSRKGTEIAIGDDHGEMRIYEISENFARPNTDEYENLYKSLDNLKVLNQETNHLNLNNNSDSNYINSLFESFR